MNEHRSSPFADANREKAAAASSNLAKLKDLYGDVTEKKDDSDVKPRHHDSCAEEVIRLGGPRWR
jgi:pre-mRNA-splicing factor 38B